MGFYTYGGFEDGGSLEGDGATRIGVAFALGFALFLGRGKVGDGLLPRGVDGIRLHLVVDDRVVVGNVGFALGVFLKGGDEDVAYNGVLHQFAKDFEGLSAFPDVEHVDADDACHLDVVDHQLQFVDEEHDEDGILEAVFGHDAALRARLLLVPRNVLVVHVVLFLVLQEMLRDGVQIVGSQLVIRLDQLKDVHRDASGHDVVHRLFRPHLCRGECLFVVNGRKFVEFREVPKPWEPKSVGPLEEIRKIEFVCVIRTTQLVFRCIE